MKMELTECSETPEHKIQIRGVTQKKEYNVVWKYLVYYQEKATGSCAEQN